MRLPGQWSEQRCHRDRLRTCFHGGVTARVCLILNMPVCALCDRSRARIADRRDRISFALNFFALFSFFSPHRCGLPSNLSFTMADCVAYRHSGADEIAYVLSAGTRRCTCPQTLLLIFRRQCTRQGLRVQQEFAQAAHCSPTKMSSSALPFQNGRLKRLLAVCACSNLSMAR